MQNPNHLQLLRKLFKNTTPEVFGTYFHHKNCLKDINFKLLYEQEKNKSSYCEKLKQLWESLEERQKGQILNDFLKINFFITTTNDSFAFLLRFIHKRENFDLNSLGNSKYDQTFSILITYKERFYECYQIRSLEECSTKYWMHRKDYFDDSIQFNTDNLKQYLERLKQGVQEIFRQELRGKQCQGDIVEFENKLYIYFYLQDYPQSITTFNSEERIEEKDVHPVFKMSFVIDHKMKGVNVYADSKDKRNQLHKVIAAVIFNQNDIDDYCKETDIFHPQLVLDNLIKNKRFVIDIPYGLTVTDIYINKLILINFLEDYTYSEITLDSKQTKKKKELTCGQDMIYQLLTDQKDFQNSVKYKIKSLQFIALVNDASLSKPLIKKFTINKQGLTNLGYEAVDEQIKDCLRSSGIIQI